MTNHKLAAALRICAEDSNCHTCPFYDPARSFSTACLDELLHQSANALKNTAAHVAVLQKEIEDLRAQLATVQHQNEQLREANALTVKATTDRLCREWVSVTERLPEPGKRVLATDGGFVGEFYLSERGQWKRYNVNDHSLLMVLDILWWTDFPEPPKEDA